VLDEDDSSALSSSNVWSGSIYNQNDSNKPRLEDAIARNQLHKVVETDEEWE
jgi:hypothetical protein